MGNSSRFFVNKECEYYPCHTIPRPTYELNCMFCFCPLHDMDCGGDYRVLANGIKDCSNCVYPHDERNYDEIMGRIILRLKL